MGVGEGVVEGVGRGIGLLPHNRVAHAKAQTLQSEADAEDDVVGARHPQGTVGFEDAPRLPEPPHVELVILSQALRANRVTTTSVALPRTFGR